MSWSLDFESIKHNLIIAMRELRRQSLQLWTVAADPGVGWQSVLSELSIMRVRGSERREERRDHPVPASHQDQPAAQYTESTLTAAKLNKFLLLIRSTTASHTAQSLSSQVSRAPIGPQLARSQLWTNRRARHGEHDFIISHWGACRARLSQVYKTKVVTALCSVSSELAGERQREERKCGGQLSEPERTKYPAFVVKSVFLAWWLLLLLRCPAMALLEIGAQNTQWDLAGYTNPSPLSVNTFQPPQLEKLRKSRRTRGKL